MKTEYIKRAIVLNKLITFSNKISLFREKDLKTCWKQRFQTISTEIHSFNGL